MENVTVINISWEKVPYDIKTIGKIHGDNDYGVYQIYGHHAAYGDETLLYIGKAEKQTFGVRLNKEHWDFVESSARPTSVRIGRITKSTKPEEVLGWDIKRWPELIGVAEKILIKAHTPAFNKQEINGVFNNAFDNENFLIINKEDYGRLLPEISTLRISYRFWNFEEPINKCETQSALTISE